MNSKVISIPHGALCGSQQIGKINLFKLSSQTLYSSSSDSSSSESNSERLFKNIKIKNAFTLTPECVNFDVNCTPPNLLKDSDGSNYGFTQLLKEEDPEPENEIDEIVNVVEFNKRLSPFLSKFNKYFKLDYPEEEHKLFLNAIIENYKLLRKIKLNNKNELKSEKIIYSNEEWKFKIIASKLTHIFLIDDNKFLY